MGLPEVLISFKEKASNFTKRSSRGVVALIFKDTASIENEVTIYTNESQIKESTWSESNQSYLEMVFKSSPPKVIIVKMLDDGSVVDALKLLEVQKFDYLSVPAASDEEVESIKDWIISENEKHHLVKAVLTKCPADHECIINFTTDDILVNGKTFSSAEYTCRIAGVLATIPLSMSATYFVLDEVEQIKVSTSPNEDIDAGQLILIDDGEKIKIARAVNSLTTLTDSKGKDYQKIKIVEAMHMIYKDIRINFEDNYAGKIVNSYNNKMLFISAIESYYDGLLGTVLDSNSRNYADIDLLAQSNYILNDGGSVSELSEDEIREYNTGSKVFLSGSCKFLDAMEDMYFSVVM